MSNGSRFLNVPIMIGILLCFGGAWARDISESDIQKAKELLGKYQSGSSSKSSSSSISKKIPMVETVVEGRDPTMTMSGPTASDELFAKVHMKIANRNFKNRSFSRAISELEQVFDVIPNHPGGRFMRAVIAARQEDYPTAWRNILIAKEGKPDDPKVDTFIQRLEQSHPKPTAPIFMPGVYREVPVHASELALDAAEKLFKDQVSAQLNTLSVGPITEAGGQVRGMIEVGGVNPIDESGVKTSLQEALPGDIRVEAKENDGKRLKLSVELAGVPAKNAKARPVSGLEDFLKGVAEQTDVVIKNSREGMPDQDKKLQGTYTIAARTLLQLNSFFRKISPYTLEFSIVQIHLKKVSSKIIWEGDIQVTFLASEM